MEVSLTVKQTNPFLFTLKIDAIKASDLPGDNNASSSDSYTTYTIIRLVPYPGVAQVERGHEGGVEWPGLVFAMFVRS